MAEADRHGMNLFVVLVGQTAKARKGTSWGRVRGLLTAIDPDWSRQKTRSGLSSGEGLIWAVRDPKDGEPGQHDKRLLVVETEFASVLRVVGREGNTLSPTVRDAWDGANLETMSKNSPARATEPHISIIAHITREEAKQHLTSTEMANGFANRFLWARVQRSKCLPDGGHLTEEELHLAKEKLARALGFARGVGRMTRDPAARDLWHDVYPELSEGRPGVWGAVTARAEAQVTRLACINALLDRSSIVREEHLRAALGLWSYCDRSARWAFGSAIGDPVADAILAALRAHPDGLTRTDIRDLFQRNKRAYQIEAALALLQDGGRARREIRPTGGRSQERWFAT
jgi:hypothetical protein